RRLDFNRLGFNTIDLFQARSSLARFGLVGRETADEILQLDHAFFGLGVIRYQTLARLRRSQHVVIIVAWIQANFTVIQISHMGAHLVQEMPIMTDYDHGALITVEHPFE